LLWESMIPTGTCKAISGPWHARLAFFVRKVESIDLIFFALLIDLRDYHRGAHFFTAQVHAV
jgi:hypothetical protein